MVLVAFPIYCSPKTPMGYTVQLSYWNMEHPEKTETEVQAEFVGGVPRHGVEDGYNRFLDVLQHWYVSFIKIHALRDHKHITLSRSPLRPP